MGWVSGGWLWDGQGRAGGSHGSGVELGGLGWDGLGWVSGERAGSVMRMGLTRVGGPGVDFLATCRLPGSARAPQCCSGS